MKPRISRKDALKQETGSWMDAAGKDSTIQAVMSGINPAGCQVFSFKHPTAEELDHDFLWRTTRCLPERGRIGIFNRSYYEEVLVVRVHPEYLKAQKLPGHLNTKNIWKQRYASICDHEKHLAEIIVNSFKKLDLTYPTVGAKEKARFSQMRKLLENEQQGPG